MKRAISRWLRRIFGEVRWSPPDWVRALGAVLGRVWAGFAAARRDAPALVYGELAAIAFLLAGGCGIWAWVATRPQAQRVEATADALRPTPLRDDAVPDPLMVRFSGPAAPLDQVGRPVSEGLSVTPPLAGEWRWETDALLVFRPRGDWPVGTRYTLRLSPRVLRPGIRLASRELAFSSPAFFASITEFAFNDDPVDPQEKTVVATVVFSHAVDKTELERRIELRLRVEPVADFDDRRVRKLGFRVSYDERGGKAFIRSERIPLQEREGEARLELEPGIRALAGGPGTEFPQREHARVPSVESYFRIARAQALFATAASHEVDRLVSIEATAPLRQADLAGQVELYLLPRGRPAIGDRPAEKEVTWSAASEVVPEVLAQAERLDFEWLPSEREYMPTQSLRYRAEAGRQLYLRIRAGLRSFGGYPLAHDFAQVLAVEPFPKAVEILHQGAILSLSGSRTLSVLARGVPALQFEVSRLLPGSIPVLVALTSGPFQRPRARSYGFGSDNVAEVIRELRTLPPEEGGRAQYASLDLTPLLAKGKTPQGLFWLRVTGYDPEKKKLEGSPSDDRVLLVTDLGLFVKEAQDGSHEAFVMSLRSGEPVAAARVEMLGKNGIPVFSRETDAAGRASFPSFQGLEREHTPTVWVVQREGDLAFLPVGRDDRLLNLASFDTGGEHTRADEESLQGYLFSDRGIYRPGEEIHVAAIAKRVDWQPLPAGLPLELVVLDPRGLEVRRERVAFSPEGFEEMRLALDPSSPTGRYQIGLRLVKENAREVSLADTSVRVEEFQPDQLAIDAGFSAPPARGWLAPGDLRARVSLRNLFGTAAAGNRVRGSITLSPWYPSFAGYAGWHFFDPAAAKKSYSESLGDATTDEHGAAEFPLALERFERATYQLRFLAEGFQKENGRSVARDATAVVSPLPQLIAWKADGELGFIRAGSKRQVELVAVGPSLERVAAPQLALELVEISNVAVLTRQENGTYAYQSVRKETSRGSEPLPLPVQGLARALPTATPGSFAWIVRDASGTELNRIPFEVTGAGARGRNVERDAELRIKLDRADYAPGDEIELEVRAPYTGAGLVTIERDRVYAASWFRASTEISLQHIRVPAGLEGNAYVVVSFARALDSDEIFVSPLSSGAAPFTLRRERRVHALKLDVPERVEPGTRLRIGYDNPAPARLAVFAVDEGILQVARYSSPDPLAYLLRKRALEVKTAQILDLVFPEFKLAQALSAPGGDLDQHLAGNLNPFKRKGLPPVAYWSGIFAAPAGKGELSYDLPDHFSGTVRVLAVAVSADSVGTAERRTTVRGPFVIRPNAPYFAAPGDEFWVSALVANDLEGADANQPVRVSLAPSGGLELLGPGEVALAVAPGQDAPVRFRVRARPQLGAASLVFAAQAGERRAHTTLELSVRPGVAKRTSLASGVARGGGATELPRPRALFADGRESRVLVSGAPLALARGLVAYLDEYPHPCTEQLVSAAFPDLVLGGRRGFERDPEGVRARHARVLRALQARQDADGAFALWLPGGPVSDFVTVYATHFLIESRDRGFEVPAAVLSRALAHLEQLVHVPGRSLPELRNQAYALYLLARAGHVPARELAALRAELDERAKEAWPKDLAAGWVAATDALLHLDGDASAALRSLSLDVELARDPTGFVDSLAARGALLDLFARHFPGRARALPAEALLETARQLGGERFNTLSSSFVVLGLESLARLEAQAAAARAKLVWTGADGKPHELALEGDEIRSASVPEGAVRLELSPGGSEPVFWQLVETGYDLAPAEAPSTARIDVAREVDGADGKPVSEAHLGDSLEVHVRVRADADAVDVAVVDLLPAGFEVDLGSGELQARRSLPVARPTWTPDYVDVREDRVVLYGTASQSAREFVYRIQAAQSGRFTLPGIAAEGLYERSARAVGRPSEIRVGD